MDANNETERAWQIIEGELSKVRGRRPRKGRPRRAGKPRVIDVGCPKCGAEPGRLCYGAVNPGRSYERDKRPAHPERREAHAQVLKRAEELRAGGTP